VKPKQGSDDNFERRLLDELKAVIAEREAERTTETESAATSPAWRRAPRLALGAVAVLAAAAAVLVFSSGGRNAPRAFAVEPEQGGGVTIRIYSLEDPAGLERALTQAGIPAQVDWLPAGTTCRHRRLTPATAKTSMGGMTRGFEMGGRGPALTIGIMTRRQSREQWRAYKRGDLSTQEARESIPNISLDPASFRPDQSVVISGSPNPFAGDPEGGFQTQFQVVEGPVEPCEPVPEPASSIGAIGVPHDTENASSLTPPRPGQFLYRKTRVVQLQGWEPDGPGTGSKAKPRHFTANVLGPEGNALPALVPTTKEVWTAPEGTTRVRETLGQIEFLSSADQRRWEDAGSPPPFEYDPDEHHVGRDSAGRLVKEFPSHDWRGRHAFANVTKLSRLPTEPEALRLAIENRPAGSSPVAPSPARSHRGAVTAERLMEILSEPITSRALRAAALSALAEMPGIRTEHGVADAAGRQGDALIWVRERGFGLELIFNPDTFAVLAQAEAIFGPSATDEYGGVPAGTPFRETAYLDSEIVDSKQGR
jgi:hypothetical protein